MDLLKSIEVLLKKIFENVKDLEFKNILYDNTKII